MVHSRAGLTTFVMDELHSIVSALVGGARYGAKVRLPQALVMTFLFKRDLTQKDKLRAVLRLAWEHASNLAAFATIYKAILAVLKWSHRRLAMMPQQGQQGSNNNHGDATTLWRTLGRALLTMIVDGTAGESRILTGVGAPPGHPERGHHALIAGAVGGYFVWGRYSSLNYQVVLYLASRVLVGLWKHMHSDNSNNPQKNKFVESHPHTYPFIAAAVWGIVMALWEANPDALHPSLKQSMEEIYRYRLGNRLNVEEAEPSIDSRSVQDSLDTI